MTIEEILARLEGVTKTSNGFEARCPAHEDGDPSLTVSTGNDGRILVHCQAGCKPDKVCAAIGIRLADLFPQRNGAGAKSRIVATYDYTDETGNLLYQVVRFDPKDFRQRAPDPSAKDGWRWSMAGVPRVLYQLPRVISAIKQEQTVVLCEGEKDADTLRRHGFVSTTNVGGAGKWLDSYSDTLKDGDIVILPDNDCPGFNHARLVASKLHSVGARVRVVTIPQVPNAIGAQVKDATDYFNAGGDLSELLAAIDATPNWTPPTGQTEAQENKPADIRGAILRILTDGNLSSVEAKTRIARAVVDALQRRGCFFFHVERRDFDSAMFFDGERKRLERIHSDAFLAWLSDWLAVNRADSLFKYVAAQVETAALGEEAQGIVPEAFWAARPGAVYLSNGDGRIVKATAQGLGMVDNGTDGVLFAAGRTLAPWQVTDPMDPFLHCSLFRSAQCAADHGPDLLRLWIYSLPTNPRSKPPVCLTGPIGSGKTREAKGIAELYGLPFIASKVEDEAEDDFWPNLDQGGLLTLDNADSRCKWLADALANAATDGCSQRRKLYTDAETVTLRARAWICVTTANPLFASDTGLADRLLVIRMNRRREESSDAKLTDEILENRDAGLSHIVTTIQAALADTAPTPPGLNARHPDFAAFAVRIGRALNREAPAITAIKAAESDKANFCIENDTIGAALLAYLERNRDFIGTAAELTPKLCETDPDLKDKLSVKRLSKRLAALWPHLEKALAVATKESDRNHFTIYKLAAKAAEFAEFEMPFSENPPREVT